MQTQSLSNIAKQSFKKLIENEFQKYKNKADYVAFKFISETNRDYTYVDGRSTSLTNTHDQGLQIEIFIDGHIGYSCTSSLTSEGIQKAFESALRTTKNSARFAQTQFDLQQVRTANKGQYISQRQKNLDQLTLAEIHDYLKKTSLKLKEHSAIISAKSDAMIIECDQIYMNSLSAHIEQNFNMIVNSMSVTAQNSYDTQFRSFHGGRGNCFQIGAEYFNLDTALKNAEQVTAEAVALLSAKNCPAKTTNVILAPDQMILQIHESIGHPLELDRILGDERNFAGWSFVQPEDFGKLKYGSDIMNVSYDPLQPGELASFAFDEVGNKAEKKYLIKDGILQAGLGSLESQFRSRQQHAKPISGVANSRSSSWNRAPIDRMANINLEGGTQSLDAMISTIEDGIIMYANKSWSIDDYRRKFQFGCEYAQQIKDGRITEVIKNPNYRGITVPFWNNLVALTNTNFIETYGSPYCGKGEPSQIIRVGHSSPYAHFKNIEVFGG